MCIKIILNEILFPFIKLSRKNNEFIFKNGKYKYFIHKNSWNSERVIEIPIVLKYIDDDKRILEVGNVLSQFVDTKWDIVDKFEKGNNIINIDIIDYKPKEKYDTIITISTLEHIGFNEDVGGGEKLTNEYNDNNRVIEAIKNLKNMLNPDGRIISTIPIGYNKYIDNKIYNNILDFSEYYFFKRISKNNKWTQINKNEVINPQYGYPFSCANYVCIGIYNI